MLTDTVAIAEIFPRSFDFFHEREGMMPQEEVLAKCKPVGRFDWWRYFHFMRIGR
jgi:hypothetical protein